MVEANLATEVQELFNQNEAPARVRDPLGPFKQELNDYLQEMKQLKQEHPERAMGWLSSVSARVLEMILVTLGSESRVSTKFRVEWLIPFREELRYQYQIVSRRVSNDRFEWEVAGGQLT